MNLKKIWSRQTLVLISLFLLTIFGPALIAVDLAYLSEWINTFKMADLYAYLVFIGIISVWCIYGLAVTLKKSITGITIFSIGLCFLVIVQFIIGFVHIMLLYGTYRPILMNNCIQRQPYRFFWWSQNYKENDQLKQVFDQCTLEWSHFSTERLVSWVVYSAASGLILVIVFIHKDRLIHACQESRGYTTSEEQDEWPSIEKPMENKEEYSLPRQKLYNEIDKRKRGRLSFQRKSMVGNHYSDPAIHPFDTTRGAYPSYPMPPEDVNTVDEKTMQRQMRFNSHSSERMEYELYKSHGSEVRRRHSSFGEKRRHRGSRQGSYRKRPMSVRWSNLHTDDTITPLIETSSDLEEDEKADLINKEPAEQAS